jgi:hypothetical protein
MNENEASRDSRDRPRTTKERFAVYQEQVKTAHTTHWDWDYLRREDIERLLRERAHQERARRAPAIPPPSPRSTDSVPESRLSRSGRNA